MDAVDVLDLLNALATAGVECWLDGGWGVDALIGEQTRPHGLLVQGWVRGRAVRCAPVAEQLAMHRGYEPRPVDLLDVRRLEERFGRP